MAAPNAKPIKKSNIFASPLQQAHKVKEEERKKNMNFGYIFIGIAAVLLAIYSYQFLYPQVVDFLAFKDKMAEFEEQIEDQEVKIADLTTERDFHKAAYDEEFQQEQEILDTVFPVEPEKLEVIRLLENFATHLDNAYPTFEFNAVQFRNPEEKDGYMILPFQTTITTSQANFERFLGLVDVSGNLDPESPDHIRLMEISKITLQEEGVDRTGKDLGVTFNVSMRAFFRGEKVGNADQLPPLAQEEEAPSALEIAESE